MQTKDRKVPGFHWKNAIRESLAFLTIQHSILAWQDYKWVTAEGPPFNHYWRDYKKSLSTWANTGWDDGDPFLDNYIAHPLQGALTGYIQIQNDPIGATLEFSNTRTYWISRLKAFAWSAVNSTQWEIGPLSEMTVEKYGTWPAWERKGKMVNGVGQVDLVVTPIAGTAYLVSEDLLDRYVIKRVEQRTGNRWLTAITRCALNPVRGAANVLHGKSPWYRASRGNTTLAKSD